MSVRKGLTALLMMAVLMFATMIVHPALAHAAETAVVGGASTLVLDPILISSFVAAIKRVLPDVPSLAVACIVIGMSGLFAYFIVGLESPQTFIATVIGLFIAAAGYRETLTKAVQSSIVPDSIERVVTGTLTPQTE